MRNIIAQTAVTAFFLLISNNLMSQLPAFPGAEGYGSTTIGGRGGQVIKVTNTNANGAGSLRQALEGVLGPRIVVFETGGTIDLLGDDIIITSPFVTIAGQTAPGDGIAIKSGGITINTNDVIIRGIRFRVGDYLKPNQHWSLHSGVKIKDQGLSKAFNVIVDHCSFSWCPQAGGYIFQGADNVTFSWNIIAEGLHESVNDENKHSKGLVFHSTADSNLTAHHNVFVSNNERNPNILSKRNEVINNYVYNYGEKCMNVFLTKGRDANIIGNYYLPGPDSYSHSSNPAQKGISIEFGINGQTGDTATIKKNVFVLNNIGPGRLVINTNSLNEEWTAVDDQNNFQPAVTPTFQIAQSPSVFPSTGITTYSTVNLSTKLFDPICGAGAIIPNRDGTDIGIINKITSNTGQIIDCVSGTPIIITGTAQAGSFNTITLSTLASPVDTRYNGFTIGIISGPAAGSTANITNYNGASRTATVSPNWTVSPSSLSVYQMTISCTKNAGGWPTYAVGSAATDTDNDGMPNNWETSNGTNPNLVDNNSDLDADGYRNIEEYINSFYTSCITTNMMVNAQTQSVLSIYPNPSNGIFNIHSSLEIKTIIVYNTLGQELLKNSSASSQFELLDLTKFGKGIYFYKVSTSDEKVSSGKLLVE